VVKLGGDVEQAVFGSEDGHVGTDAVAEVEASDYLLGGDIDDDEAGAVGAGLANAGIAVDGHIGEPAIGRGDNFMTCFAAFGDRGEDGACDWIDDGKALLALLRDQEAGLLCGGG